MNSLPDNYRALVIGASGGIGAAFVAALQADPRCTEVTGLHRQSQPPIDYRQEASVGDAAAALAAQGQRFHLILVATGVLHSDGQGSHFQPEKRLAELSLPTLEAVFRINTFGPALVLRHFSPLLDRQRSVLAVLSAKVGSIEDNRLGGWYAYRASKAALNMLLKTAAIELRRTHPGTVLAALHPGTVRSGLSRPFKGDQIGQEPALACAGMLGALDSLPPDDSGCFVSYNGLRLPW